MVLILKDKYFVANAGDSRCLLIKKNWDTIWLTEDHKPECPKELEWIIKAKGFVSDGRVNSNLNLSRAIGDL